MLGALRAADVSTVAIGTMIRSVGDLRLLGAQLDGAAKRLEEQARTDAEHARTAEERRRRIAESIRDFLSTVASIKGAY